MLGGVQFQCTGRSQVRGHAHCIPADVDCLVHIRSGPFQPSRVHLFFGRLQQRLHPFQRHAQSFGDFFRGSAYVQHVLGGIVMHFADFVTVIVKACDIGSVFGENGPGFI